MGRRGGAIGWKTTHNPGITVSTTALQPSTQPCLVMVWVAYRVGDGVLIYPVAADAWALRATALGWPEGVLEIGDDVNSHQQEPGGRPW